MNAGRIGVRMQYEWCGIVPLAFCVSIMFWLYSYVFDRAPECVCKWNENEWQHTRGTKQHIIATRNPNEKKKATVAKTILFVYALHAHIISYGFLKLCCRDGAARQICWYYNNRMQMAVNSRKPKAISSQNRLLGEFRNISDEMKLSRVFLTMIVDFIQTTNDLQNYAYHVGFSLMEIGYVMR